MKNIKRRWNMSAVALAAVFFFGVFGYQTVSGEENSEISVEKEDDDEEAVDKEEEIPDFIIADSWETLKEELSRPAGAGTVYLAADIHFPEDGIKVHEDRSKILLSGKNPDTGQINSLSGGTLILRENQNLILENIKLTGSQAAAINGGAVTLDNVEVEVPQGAGEQGIIAGGGKIFIKNEVKVSQRGQGYFYETGTAMSLSIEEGSRFSYEGRNFFGKGKADIDIQNPKELRISVEKEGALQLKTSGRFTVQASQAAFWDHESEELSHPSEVWNSDDLAEKKEEDFDFTRRKAVYFGEAVYEQNMQDQVDNGEKEDEKKEIEENGQIKANADPDENNGLYLTVPEKISFEAEYHEGDPWLVSRKKECSKLQLQVHDDRESKSGWAVSVKAKPLTDKNGKELESGIVFVDEQGERHSLEEEYVIAEFRKGGNHMFEWGPNAGVFVFADPAEIEPDVSYESVVSWRVYEIDDEREETSEKIQ